MWFVLHVSIGIIIDYYAGFFGLFTVRLGCRSKKIITINLPNSVFLFFTYFYYHCFHCLKKINSTFT